MYIWVSFVLWGLPFIFAGIHQGVGLRKGHYWGLTLIYFLFLNVFLKLLPPGIAMAFNGQPYAADAHLAYSPMLVEYGVALLSFSFIALISVCFDYSFRLAVALMYIFFSIFAAIMLWVQWGTGAIPDSPSNVFVLASDFVTAALLMLLVLLSYKQKN